MTASTKAGTTTTYAYAGTTSNELLSEAATGGDTYSYAYGRADHNGLPEIEQVAYTHNASTANAYRPRQHRPARAAHHLHRQRLHVCL